MVRGDFIWQRFIQDFSGLLPDQSDLLPWQLTADSVAIVEQLFGKLDSSFRIENGIAIHSNAQLESNVIIKSPAIIGPACFVAANTYLRGGVYLMGHNSIGPGVEIKSSFMFPNSNLAHFNFVGDSVIGSNVNFEAGAATANYFNERSDRRIEVIVNGNRIDTGVEKFGALVSDKCKIGANAVLSPGTVLPPDTIVKRLELVDQQLHYQRHLGE